MNIGIPKESRPFEYRVGLSPAGVDILVQNGHQVFVEHDAGVLTGFSDADYEKVGARLVYSPEESFGRSDLVLKVTRPTERGIELAPTRTRSWLVSCTLLRPSKTGLIPCSKRKSPPSLMSRFRLPMARYPSCAHSARLAARWWRKLPPACCKTTGVERVS